MGTKGWIIFAVLTVAVLGGLVYMSQSNRLDVSDVETNSILKASDQSGEIGDRAKGNLESKHLLVEYGDFQCPSCAGVYPHVESLLEKVGDEIAFVYRNFPLASLHPNALAAATAAEAAGKQGKYWEMYEFLFTNQNDWQDASPSNRQDTFTQYADRLQLDTDKFAEDYDSAEIKKKINFDMALGSKDKVSGTPTFFFNGERLPDDIEAALSKGDVDTVQDWIENSTKK